MLASLFLGLTDSRPLQLICVVLGPDQDPLKTAQDSHEIIFENASADVIWLGHSAEGRSLDIGYLVRDVIPLIFNQIDFQGGVGIIGVALKAGANGHSSTLKKMKKNVTEIRIQLLLTWMYLKNDIRTLDEHS